MDPVSAVGLVGAVIGIANAIAKSVTRLTMLRNKYTRADLSLSLLIGQLYIIQAALNQIANLRGTNNNLFKSGTTDWTPVLEHALQICNALMMSLNERLDDFETRDKGQLTAKGKLSMLWREDEIEQFVVILDRQVNASNLFVAAFQR